MLQFYFDFIDKYIDRSDFTYLNMDTDSAYIAFSGEIFEELIKPELKEDFLLNKYKWFPDHSTPEMAKYSKRTPGLFKVEYAGKSLISLCPNKNTLGGVGFILNWYINDIHVIKNIKIISLKEMINKYRTVISIQTSFPEIIDKVINTYNNQPHRTIKSTLNEMFDGVSKRNLILIKIRNLTEIN